LHELVGVHINQVGGRFAVLCNQNGLSRFTEIREKARRLPLQRCYQFRLHAKMILK